MVGNTIVAFRNPSDLQNSPLTEVPRQLRPAPASRPGLQSGQIHADAGLAEGGRALVIDHAAGKVGEDRCENGRPWPVRHIPIGRGCRPKKLVPENPEPDQWSTAKTCSGVGRGNRRPGENDRRGVSEWRKIWTNGLPNAGRLTKSCHRMTAKGI